MGVSGHLPAAFRGWRRAAPDCRQGAARRQARASTSRLVADRLLDWGNRVGRAVSKRPGVRQAHTKLLTRKGNLARPRGFEPLTPRSVVW